MIWFWSFLGSAIVSFAMFVAGTWSDGSIKWGPIVDRVVGDVVGFVVPPLARVFVRTMWWAFLPAVKPWRPFAIQAPPTIEDSVALLERLSAELEAESREIERDDLDARVMRRIERAYGPRPLPTSVPGSGVRVRR